MFIQLIIHKHGQNRLYSSLLSCENFAAPLVVLFMSQLQWKEFRLLCGLRKFCHPQVIWNSLGRDSKMHSGLSVNKADFWVPEKPRSCYKIAGMRSCAESLPSHTEMHTSAFYSSFAAYASQLNADSLVPHSLLVLKETESVFTRMGVYHFRLWGAFLLWDFFGLGSKGSYSCSGIFTTAFFGFSSLAPSSVEPFPPQRTCRRQATHEDTTTLEAVNVISSGPISICPSCHLHPLDPSDSSSSVIGGIHGGPLLLGQAVFIIWLLKHK